MQITTINKIAFKTSGNFQQAFNDLLLEKFQKYLSDKNIKRTHLFNGRYENIYLNEKHIPEISVLIKQAIDSAEKILKIKNLRAGYWFNYMPPGSTTTLHTHDDGDELLSGVYYIAVPKNSGALIIYNDTKTATDKKTIIRPNAGEFIFFKPNVRHEVSKNSSNEHRLSVGINFGESTPSSTDP